jgi:hypothetical protein
VRNKKSTGCQDDTLGADPVNGFVVPASSLTVNEINPHFHEQNVQENAGERVKWYERFNVALPPSVPTA